MRCKKGVTRVLLLLILSMMLYPLLAINQSGIVDQAVALYDEEKYGESVELFMTVDENDSSYVRMLSELALAYNALESYDSAIYCCRRGLEDLSSYENNLYSTMASSYDMKGEVDTAIYYYRKALTLEPYNSLDHFNIGVTYYNSKQYVESVNSFQEALRCNPFHASSHLYLGLLAARQNQLTKAMMSIEAFLMLEPSSGRSNTFLVFLNNLSQSYVDTVYGEAIEPFLDNTPYEYSDRIIRSRVVLVDDFETVIDFNAPLVKQTQVLFDKLPKEQTEDFWSELYWGFFTAIKAESYIEPMLYTILRSVGGEVINKWTEKNDKLLAEFYNVGSHFSTIQKYRYLNLDGELKKYTLGYDDGQLSSIGNYDGEKQVGYWQYYWSHGGLRSEGMFDQDEKVGSWKYYSWEGQLDFVSEMKQGMNNGPAQKFYPSQVPYYILNYTDGDPDGEVQFYSKSGTLTETSIFVKGQRDGKTINYNGTGDTSSVYYYKEGKLDGESVNYHSDGSLMETSHYSAGLLDGDYKFYHYGGQLQSAGHYENGNRAGDWRLYFENGKLNQQLFYNDTVICGERRDYYRSGPLSTLYHYNGKGELDGDVEYYTREGLIYMIETYKVGKIVGLKNYGSDSELIDQFSSEESTFAFKTYYLSGALKREGQFVNGQNSGEWISYWQNGNVKRSEHYSEGIVIKEQKSFYMNGQLENWLSLKSNGPYDEYISYHINGEVKSKGLMKDGKNLHHWLYYRVDGSLEQKTYFVEGQSDGWLTNYTAGGKISSRTSYDNGLPMIQKWYNEDEEVINEMDNSTAKTYEIKSESGQTLMKVGYLNFLLEDTMTWYYPTGQVRSKSYCENDNRQGNYCSWTRAGDVGGKGLYWNGEKHGEWQWYHDGSKSLSGEYFYVNGERDSVQKHYNEEGILVKELYYQHGEKHGTHAWFSDAGEPMIRLTYKHDELISYQQPTVDGWKQEELIIDVDEKIQSYYPDGKKAVEIQLKDYLYEGALIVYNNAGDVSREQFYSKGLENGTSEVYYANGQLKHRKQYLWGEINGEAMYYHPNGQLKKKCNYYMGDSDGVDHYYSENGVLLSTEVNFADRFIRFDTAD